MQPNGVCEARKCEQELERNIRTFVLEVRAKDEKMPGTGVDNATGVITNDVAGDADGNAETEEDKIEGDEDGDACVGGVEAAELGGRLCSTGFGVEEGGEGDKEIKEEVEVEVIKDCTEGVETEARTQELEASSREQSSPET